MSCLWRAVNRVYCNKQHCTVHVCSVTWRKSLLLFGALNRPVRSAEEAMLGRGRAVRSVKRLPGEHGWGWCPGQAQVPALGGENGIRASPAGPTRSTDSCSQPWNSSSETRVIKECTNCESPLKKIKSSVSAPRPHAWMQFPRSAWAGRAGSPAPSPSPRAGTRLFVAGGSLGQRGGRQEVGGTRLPKVTRTGGTHPSPTVRAPA